MYEKYWKPLLIMMGVIVISSIAARSLNGHETLSDYASKNPDIAYGSSSVSSTSVSDLSVNSASDSSCIGSSMAITTIEASSEIDSSEKNTLETSSNAAVESTSIIIENEANPDRIIYHDGFYYEPINEAVKAKIYNISYADGCPVDLSDLRYCCLKYVDFDGNTQEGEMICNKAIAQDVMEIFYDLYINEYQIESIRLIDEFNGDDTASMEANNTSCFNYRVVEGTNTLSRHAYGMAIDLNPFYNPYITYNNDGSTNCSPVGSRQYEDRSQNFPYKIDENDLAYKLFIEHGFTWGGNWNSCKDYQHFQKKE
ncbi:MAG: M15 family metallopeptidase [Butyrivibrio sp.]|nr:M15 family metallopeptidase [Butyrivibrio sp.]